MIAQLQLDFGQKKDGSKKKLQPWLKNDLRPLHRGDARYNPRAIRRVILSVLSSEEWTTFSDLCDVLAERLGQHSRQTLHVLDFLLARRRIERVRLYFREPVFGLNLSHAERMNPPAGCEKYMGFEWGYRLCSSTPEQPALIEERRAA
jgi:hypothetical protein